MAKANKTARKTAKKATAGTQGGARAFAQRVNLTFGELVAAAFDAVGTEARDVARLLTSRDLNQKMNRRIVCEA